MKDFARFIINASLEYELETNGYFFSHLFQDTNNLIFSKADIETLIDHTVSAAALNLYSDFSNLIHQLPNSNKFHIGDNLLAEEYGFLLDAKILAKDKPTKKANNLPPLNEDIYKKYKDSSELFIAKIKDYNSSYIKNKTDSSWKENVMPNLLFEINNLKAQWENEGKKSDVEKILNSYYSESNLNFSSLWALWAGKFCEYISLNSDFKGVNSNFATFHLPFANLLESEKWETISYNHENINSIAYFLPFKEFTVNFQKYLKKVENVTFEYQKLRIERNWLVPKIFEAEFWKFGDGFENIIISDGNLGGQIASYIEEVIFVKNICLETRKNLLETGLEWLGDWAYRKINKTPINDENIYIVAFNCKKIPKCPNPDLSLDWPK